ncbi:MAG: anti-sigma factor antagonist [Candidatus Omnitrophica bacterium COP1]|nr:anti-sigma factor antagonist [Candidatus Omnitrophica bacterium COP1]
MGEIKAELHRLDDHLLVTLIGTLDATTLSAVEPVLARLIDNQHEAVILNLYECEYIDSPGLERLNQFWKDLQEHSRALSLYVRPMSYVSLRTRLFSQIPVPPGIAQIGETRLAQRRAERLARWNREKPIPADGAPGPLPIEPQISETDLIPIDFAQVASLAGKDERVVKDVWQTYCKLLDEGDFEPSQDGSAATQLELDSRRVAHVLRLDWHVVQMIITSVTSHLNDTFGHEN